MLNINNDIINEQFNITSFMFNGSTSISTSVINGIIKLNFFFPFAFFQVKMESIIIMKTA